jgi:tetraacyldisaccharide 4'-kinase
MISIFRKLLWPVSLLFGVIVRLRRWMYSNVRSRFSAPVPVVVVGNLASGGTGKTPHTARIAELLLHHGKRPAWLSRGYGRNTSCFHEVDYSEKPSEAGDEPLMVKQRFPELPVFVCANRKEGIIKLLRSFPQTEVILLDDAFQHLRIKPHISVVLLTHRSLTEPWYLLPSGDGREPLSALRHADAVVVTKCPTALVAAEKERLTLHLRQWFGGPVFFSEYVYHHLENREGKTPEGKEIHLLAGIADPLPMLDYLKSRFEQVHPHFFRDHHAFSRRELDQIFTLVGNAPLVTTEKDRVRILEVMPESAYYNNLYTLPVTVRFQEDNAAFERWLMASLFPNQKK